MKTMIAVESTEPVETIDDGSELGRAACTLGIDASDIDAYLSWQLKGRTGVENWYAWELAS